MLDSSSFNPSEEPPPIYTEAVKLAELARMDDFSFGRARKAAAKELGISVSVLDQEVKALRRSLRVQNGSSAKPWLGQCQYSPQGDVRSNLANALLAIRADPRASVARYDEMQRLPILMQPVPGAQIDGAEQFQPRPIRDEDYTHIQEWLQREGLAGC